MMRVFKALKGNGLGYEKLKNVIEGDQALPILVPILLVIKK